MLAMKGGITMNADRFHQAYLLRLWAVHHNAEVCWRAAIENVHTGERHAFADLAALCDFLIDATVAVAPLRIDEAGDSGRSEPPL